MSAKLKDWRRIANRTVRHEWLVQTIEVAQDQAKEWLWTYINDRPNIGYDGITAAMKLKLAEYF